MEMLDVLFVFFAAMVVLPVVYMLLTKNIIRAAFALAVSLLGLAAIYVLLHAELMAVVQILIYAGGIIVLVIFGIMLTRRVSGEGVVTYHRNVIFGGAIVAILLGLLIWAIWQSELTWNGEAHTVNQVQKVGVSLMTTYLLSFEVVAFLLLVALVGASYLAKKSGN